MAATLSNAIKTLIEQSGLGLAAYRDGDRDAQNKPCVTIHEGISRVPVGRSDGGVGVPKREIVQVDLWEEWFWDGELVEDPALAAALEELLHSGELRDAPTRVHGMKVVSGRRLTEPDNNIVHNVWTVEVDRD